MPHWVVPEVAHGFVGVQDAPWVQAVQTCVEEQTWFVPQVAPVASQLWSVQTGVPVPQAIAAPVAQGFVEVQVAPAVQGEHTPALQTRFVPQETPFGPATPVSTQTGVPVEQAMVPTSHGFVGVQAPPLLHGMQAGTGSAEQTSPEPQGWPAAR